MKRIVLLPNREKDPALALSLRALSVLLGFCTHVYTEAKNEELIASGATPYAADAFPEDAELLLVLGGDGTMLHASALAVRYGIPMLGINIGRLGYLASVEPSEIESLTALASDAFTEQARMLLDVTLEEKSGSRRFLGYALNDLVIDGCGHLADLRLCEKQSYLDYRADGLIVATPTGSTAYSLSAGGPVLDESMDAICVTPICPRSFFSRSLLFPEDATLRIVNMGTREGGVRISMDGCIDEPMAVGDAVEITRSQKRVRILSLRPRHLLEVLSTKMNTQHF